MKKKALMVSTIIGFLGTFEINDIRILQNIGYEVHCACNCDISDNKIVVDNLRKAGIIEHHIPFARYPFTMTNIKAYKRLKQLISEEDFDLVHCHTPVGGVLGRMAAKSLQIPMIIYTAHGFHFFKGCPLKNRIMFYPIEMMMSHCTDILITINNEDFVVAKKKFKAKRTERIHGVGIDIEKFCSVADSGKEKRKELGVSENEIMLLSVGELNRDKNHIEVLEAMRSLAPKGYKYFVAGNGNLKDSYNEFIKTNSLEKSVELLGYRQDISELLQAADIYVFPSLFEGISVALMEAVAAKLPIACSKVRGNVDTVLTPESYFNTKNADTLVKAIEQIASMNKEHKQAMVETNYQNLLKYRLSEVQKEMTEIYKIADEAVERARKNG